MRRVLAVSMLGLALAFASTNAVVAQDAGTPTASAEVGSPAADSTGTAPGVVAAPVSAATLPTQAPPPRTLRAYWHLFVAFALTWLLLFGYAVSVGRRFAALERDIQRLGGSAGA